MGDFERRSDAATGGCLCGAVRFRVRGPLRDVVNCHCGMCLKSHGHVAAYTAVKADALALTEQAGLRWYASSDKARRGFCATCGASLFWAPADADYVAVAAGSLDRPTGLKTVGHIFVSEKGDYYDITDGLTQHALGMTAAQREDGLS